MSCLTKFIMQIWGKYLTDSHADGNRSIRRALLLLPCRISKSVKDACLITTVKSELTEQIFCKH